MALQEYSDSNWKPMRISLPYWEVTKYGFKGIGWLRLHFTIDSSTAGKPIALMLRQSGASEFYLDGKKLKSFGVINGPDSSVYHNPQRLPYIFTIPAAG